MNDYNKIMQTVTVILYISTIVHVYACVNSKSDHAREGNWLGFHCQNAQESSKQVLGHVVFKAVWNVPRNKCQSKFGVNLNLDLYGIQANPVNTDWNGDVITIFYNKELGLYPAYVKDDHTGGVRKINAGLPQLTNMTKHYEKATDDIMRAIPDEHFSGLAVIDWEHWFPQFNFPSSIMDLYRGPSIDLVRKRHPSWDNATVELVAKLEYEESAKHIMEGTLLLGQTLRPKGLWGFYHYPYCFNAHAGEECKDEVKKDNDDLASLFRQTTAFYPSIYINDHITNSTSFIEARLEEALRIRKTYGYPKQQPMFSYCRFNYSHTSLYYTLNNLNATILKSAEAGLEGVIFWGDHNDTSSRESCQNLQRYVQSALGPTVKQTAEAAVSCSRRLCSGNGRCKGKILQCKQRKNELTRKAELPNESHNLHNGKTRILDEVCTCLCFSGWTGDDCASKITL